MNLTIEEVEKDLEISKRDLQLMDLIVCNINNFIQNDLRENRSEFRKDIRMWKALQEKCRRIHNKIESKYAELKSI